MEFNLGEKYTVTVQKILSGGIIVSLESGETEFVHKSKISNEFINDIGDFVSVGDTYTAVVVEGKTKPTELSLREDNAITRKTSTVAPPPTKVFTGVKSESRSRESMTLEEMISKSTEDMQDKFKGRDKTTGARNKKSHRRNRKGGN